MHGERGLLGDEVQQPQFLVSERIGFLIILQRDDANRAAGDQQRRAEPQGGGTLEGLELAAGPEQWGELFAGDAERAGGGEDVLRESVAERTRRWGRDKFVDEVRERGLTAGGIEQGDVEILRRHQARDNPVNFGEQCREIAAGEDHL